MTANRRRRLRYVSGGKAGCRFAKLAAVFFALLVLVLTCFAVWLVRSEISPNLEEIGRLRAKVMVSQIVNKAVNDQLADSAEMQELLIRKTGEDGQLQVLQANAQAMNLLMTEIAEELQEEYAQRPEDIFYVSAGVLLGEQLLSQTGPDVKIRVIPLSVASMDFKTEFQSEGINQTKYKVYIELVSEVKVLAPLVADTFQVSASVLVAEAIILGSVPGSYVQVPEEDILDVTNE